MITNYLNPIVIGILCIVITPDAISQTKVYANTVSASAESPNFPFSSYVDNVNQSIDGNLNTAANIRSSSGGIAGINAYTGYLELEFPTTLPANTTSYIKIRTDDNILEYLTGGSLGGILSGLSGNILTGNQEFTVQAKNNTTVVATAQSSQPSDFSGSEFRVIYNSIGEYFIMLTPQSSYNRVRITNTLGALVGLGTTKVIDVYGAFYTSGSAACNIGKYTSYSAIGLNLDLVNLGGTAVTNPHHAIDSDASNYSQLSTGILGVAASVAQTVYFDGPSAQDDQYQIQLEVASTLLTAGITNNIDILAYNGASLVQQYTLSSLLTADLLTLLQQDETVAVTITPGVVDRITIRLSTAANVAVQQNLNIYAVVKGNFDIAITGEGSYAVNDLATLTASVNSCNGPYTYSWTGEATALGNEIIPETDTPGPYAYQVTVIDKYGITQRKTATIVVEEPPVGGTITNQQNICADTVPDSLTLTGQTGNVVRWEKSDNSDFTTVQTIANTTTTLSSTDIGTLTQTTYFRAVVSNFTYPEVYSETGSITIAATEWNGTEWSNGEPDSTTAILFTGNYIAANDIEGCSIDVSNNAVVNIPSGYNVVINGAITVNSGSFTLQNNANLIQLTDAVNSGDIIVKKNSSNLFRLDYTIWSSPVADQNLLNFSPLTATNRFYTYITETDFFETIDPETNDFETAEGCLIRMPNSLPDSGSTAGYNAGNTSYTFTGDFIGVPNNGTINKSLLTIGNSFNMVGNPYPSPINIHAFFDGNTNNIAPNSPLYFWRKTNDPTVSSYATLTKFAYTPNIAPGGDTGSDTFIGDPSLWVINQGQGFIIEAASNTVTFTNSMRRQVNNGQFFRPGAEPDNNKSISRYWINLYENENFVSQAVIGHSNTTTNMLDHGWDGKLLENYNTSMLFSLGENKKLSIQAKAPFNVNDSTALGYYAKASGSYSLSLDKFDGIFKTEQDIYLLDKVTATVHNLKNGGYTFNTQAGLYEDRFIIIYQQPLLNSKEVQAVNNSNVIVYKNNSAITISSNTSNINSIIINDSMGRLLYKSDTINTQNFTINIPHVSRQIILVTVNTATGTSTKKVL